MSASINFTRRAALFRSLKFPDVAVTFTQTPGDTDAWSYPGYTRISEWMDVTFQPITSDTDKAIMEDLLAERRSIEAKSAKDLAEIDGRIAHHMGDRK